MVLSSRGSFYFLGFDANIVEGGMVSSRGNFYDRGCHVFGVNFVVRILNAEFLFYFLK